MLFAVLKYAKYLWLFSLTIAQSKPEESHSSSEEHLTNLLLQLQQERNFRTLLWMGNADCGVATLIGEFLVPKIILESEHTFYLKKFHNSQVLVLVCLSYDVDYKLLRSLSSNLHHMRLSRIVFMWKQPEAELPNLRMELLKLVEFCQQNDMINIIVVFSDFYQTGKYFSFHHYDHTQLETFSFFKLTGKIFPNKLKNLRGKRVLTMNDRDVRLSTYLLKLMKSFLAKSNATLTYLNEADPYIYGGDILKLTYNRTIDVGITLQGQKFANNLNEYSYPVQTVQWLVMVPTAPDIPTREMFFKIIANGRVCLLIFTLVISLSILQALSAYNLMGRRSYKLYKLDFIFNDRIIQALMAKSFEMPKRNQLNRKIKFVYCLALLSGLWLTTMYLGYLNTYCVHLPSQPAIDTFADLVQSRYKILLYRQDVQKVTTTVGEEFWHKYKNAFKIAETPDEFIKMRNSFNTTLAYGISSPLWFINKKQMESFTRQIFRTPDQMKLDVFMPMAMPIYENSIYKQQLDQFLLDAQAFGMIHYWLTLTFYEMVASGKIFLSDPTSKRTIQSMVVEDLHYIWLLYLAANSFALFVFAMEFMVFEYQGRKRRN